MKYVAALILIAHGLGHIMGFLAAWTTVKVGFTDEPWLLSHSVHMGGAVGRVFGLLWLVALIAFVGAGVGLLAGQSWWAVLAFGAAVVSLVAILPWWNTVTPSSRLWATAVDILVIVVLAVWGKSVVE